MTNYILVHHFDGAVDTRYDFGNDLEKLYDFFDNVLLFNITEIGILEFTVIEEFSGEIIDTMTVMSNAG